LPMDDPARGAAQASELASRADVAAEANPTRAILLKSVFSNILWAFERFLESGY
jgi:hypothetical protein